MSDDWEDLEKFLNGLKFEILLSEVNSHFDGMGGRIQIKGVLLCREVPIRDSKIELTFWGTGVPRHINSNELPAPRN